MFTEIKDGLDRKHLNYGLLKSRSTLLRWVISRFGGGGGGLLPYMGYIGMCREEYGFQAVHSSIGYINQSVWV